MANEMSSENGLPPKLDLRKRVVSPLPGNPEGIQPAPAIQPVATPAASPLATPVATVPQVSTTPTPVAPAKPLFTPATGTVRLNMEGRPALTPKPLTALRPMLKPISPVGGPSAAAPAPVSDARPVSPTVAVAQVPGAPATMAAGEAPTVEAPVLAEPTPRDVIPALEPPAAPIGTTPSLRPVMQPVLTAKTIKLKKPAPIGIKRDAPELDAEPGTKRDTSKITLPGELDAQPAQPAPVGGVQTIRIAPTATTSIAPLLAGDTGSGSGAVAPVLASAQPVDPKRQTSRISLEAALGNESGSPSGPKTIKLKKPGSPTAVMRKPGLGAPPPSVVADEPVEPAAPAPAAEESDDESTNTQKKTIKVKRPSVHPAMRPGGDAGHSGGASTSGTAPLFVPPSFAAVQTDSAHWFFITCACAATVIIGVLIYVLCAQVMGPNISLTELAYFAPDAELPWPGRITR